MKTLIIFLLLTGTCLADQPTPAQIQEEIKTLTDHLELVAQKLKEVQYQIDILTEKSK